MPIDLPPLALYLHYPWCVQKCPYCDFNSHRAPAHRPDRHYVDALLADLDFELEQLQARPLQSLFIGGGTPSLLAVEELARLLAGIAERCRFTDDVEITLEANPGTVDGGHFAGYREAGINRLSLGVQSLSDPALKALGRIHDRTQAIRAVDSARSAGFDNLNLDLMFGLPGQQPGDAMHELEALIGLRPEHISYYQLTLEPNTAFAANPPPLPTEESLWEMQQAGRQRLADAGYAQYEVSAYARAGHRCRHNLNYWQFGDYLGIGAGAHAKLTATEQQQVVRRWRARSPQRYLQQAGSAQAIAGEQVLAAADLRIEFMMNALRLREGFPLSLFERHTGLPADALAAPLAQAQQLGLVSQREGWVCGTERGQRFLNDLLTLFLVDSG